MLKIGLIGLATSVGCIALMALLSGLGIVEFGPSGPAGEVGFFLVVGVLACDIIGLFLTIVGLVEAGVRKLRTRANGPQAEYRSPGR